MRRIICIGNSLILADSAGPQIYSQLQHSNLPEDVELIDGGTKGLDLLPFFDGAKLVILIDQVSGYSSGSDVVLLQGGELFKATEKRFDHQTGIGYLLRILPEVCEVELPELKMIGIEGCLNERKKQKCLNLLQQLLNI